MNAAPPAPLAPGPALTFLVGPYRLWVDALWIREVIPPKAAPISGHEGARPASEGSLDGLSGGGHLSWRNRLVPVIDLGALLGHPCDPSDLPPEIDMVYGESETETLVSLRVSRVIGLRHWAPIEVRPLPPLPPDLERLFAGIILDPASGPGLLWFRAQPELLLRLWRDRPKNRR